MAQITGVYTDNEGVQTRSIPIAVTETGAVLTSGGGGGGGTQDVQGVAGGYPVTATLVDANDDPVVYSDPTPVEAALLNPSDLTSVSISSAAATTVAVVAAVASQTTRLHGLILVAAADCTIQIASAATGRSGVMQLIKGVPFILPISERPWYTTGVNEALNIVQGQAVQLSGTAWYVTSV